MAPRINLRGYVGVGQQTGIHSGLRSRCDAFKTLFDGLTPNIRFVVFEYTLEYERVYTPQYSIFYYFSKMRTYLVMP